MSDDAQASRLARESTLRPSICTFARSSVTATDTLRALRRAGATMIFFGAESGSDKVLASMNKRLTSGQTLELAARIRNFGIIPEFSFVIGNPADPEGDTRDTIRFIRKIKRLNQDAEIIVQHYIPTPHPDGMYGKIDSEIRFPDTPEEWATPRWYNFTVRKDPRLPCARNRPHSLAPQARDTSSRSARRCFLPVRDAGPLPAITRRAPAAEIPN